ncbi:CPBP family intramembrane glutamic endopeptidase [Sphaerisporangium corydalis]|uniref:CPBP family intramembrane glutamic endopeptidase n=1 Tax=Sphaerisporangium corydalis TaxID=1441875 RepID=A0ABV9EDD3_9ACTN|nr:type II CAAX endopeptidase family protein [Sphaerisporangium corydalis]
MRTFLRRHPMAGFFLLAYGLSWLAWLPYVLSADGLAVFPFRYPMVLGTSQFLGVMPGAYLGPIFSAYLLTRLVDGRPGVRRWLRAFLRFRAGARWYLLALAGVPVIMMAATFALPGAAGALRPPAAPALLAFPPMLLVQLVTTGLAEEPGWREYALPRMQERYGPMAGALILGPLWAGWHLPLFLTGWGTGASVLGTMVEFLFFTMVLNIVVTWLFNSTRESLPVVMLFHANINNFGSVLWPAFFPAIPVLDSRYLVGSIGFGALALVVVIATRGRLGYRRMETCANAGQRYGAAADIC